jgi:hypothetical protein
VVRRVAFLAAIALSSTAWAQLSLDGMGRVTGLVGWRYTPNTYFENTASNDGFPVTNARLGGPAFSAEFGYGATATVEVNIDLVAGFDELSLSQFGPVHTVTYGGLLGVRLERLLFPSVWPRGVIPFIGGAAGPTIVDVTGGWFPLEESSVTGFAANGGFMALINDHWAATLEVKLLWARGAVPLFGGINGGGVWMGLGLAWLIPRTGPEGPARHIDRPMGNEMLGP